jgi:hypothetical protein
MAGLEIRAARIVLVAAMASSGLHLLQTRFAYPAAISDGGPSHNAFHEKAGGCQVVSSWFLLATTRIGVDFAGINSTTARNMR